MFCMWKIFIWRKCHHISQALVIFVQTIFSYSACLSLFCLVISTKKLFPFIANVFCSFWLKVHNHSFLFIEKCFSLYNCITMFSKQGDVFPYTSTGYLVISDYLFSAKMRESYWHLMCKKQGCCKPLQCRELLPPKNLSDLYRGGLPWWLSGKDSACNVGDLGSTPGSRRSDPLEKAMATHSSILPWEILQTEEPSGP